MNKITKAFFEAPLSVLFPDGWMEIDDRLFQYVEKDGVKINLDDLSLNERKELSENHEVMCDWKTDYVITESDKTPFVFCFEDWGKIFEDTVETCLEVIERRVKKPSSEWVRMHFYEFQSCLADALHKLFPGEEIDWELVSEKTHKIIEEHLYSDEVMNFFTSEYLGNLAWMERRKDQIKETLCNMDYEEVMELFKEVTYMNVKKQANDQRKSDSIDFGKI